MATKEDWNTLYGYVVQFPELNLAKFKRCSSLDDAQTGFYTFLRVRKGINHDEAINMFPIYRYGNVIKTV